jgi:hypothetical protein
MKNTKNILAFIGFISLFSCAEDTYTSQKYFDCPPTKEFKATTEKQKLIHELLERSVVTLKDLVDYNLLKDKKNIYINRTYYSKFSGATKADIVEYQFENNDVPSQIQDVKFCLKSKDELQKIADNTSDFVFLTFGNIEINGDIATIGLATWWQPQSPPKRKAYLSGGGYVLQYKKIDGKWIYDKTLSAWMS